jgi:outer membrane immunogenic protein
MGTVMLNFRRGMLGIVLTGALAIGPAKAADILSKEMGSLKDEPIYTPMSWAGFYAGAHIGGVFGDLTVTDKNGFTSNAALGETTELSPDGVFGGFTLGYNWHQNRIVFGAEADFGSMVIGEQGLLSGTTANTAAGIHDGTYGDATIRLGYAVNRGLIYAKGGVAFYDGENEFHTQSGNYVTHSTTDTFVGWTIGGGVEYALNPEWSLKTEYQYFDFGKESFSVVKANGPSSTFDEDLTAHTVKIGLNYHVGNYQPLK